MALIKISFVATVTLVYRCGFVAFGPGNCHGTTSQWVKADGHTVGPDVQEHSGWHPALAAVCLGNAERT